MGYQCHVEGCHGEHLSKRQVCIAEPLSITELLNGATGLTAQGFSIEQWSNGTWFVRTPQGEGTEVPEEAVAGAIANLFKVFF